MSPHFICELEMHHLSVRSADLKSFDLWLSLYFLLLCMQLWPCSNRSPDLVQTQHCIQDALPPSPQMGGSESPAFYLEFQTQKFLEDPLTDLSLWAKWYIPQLLTQGCPNKPFPQMLPWLWGITDWSCVRATACFPL